MRDRENDAFARLSASSESPLARVLLRSAASDAAPERSRRRALVAASLAVASAPATSAAATGLVGAKLAILKWLGAGFVLGTTGVGAVELARVGTAERADPTPAASIPSKPRNSSPRPPEQRMLDRSPQLAAEAERPSAASTVSRAPAAPSIPTPAKVDSPPLPAYSAAFPAPIPASSPVSSGDPGRFAAQLRLVDRARRAVAEGKPHEAQALLDQLEREHPGTSFRPEAVVLRVEALMKSGNRGAAEALARHFVQAHPQHPLVPRVRTLVGVP
jgi:hypothetical protein